MNTICRISSVSVLVLLVKISPELLEESALVELTFAPELSDKGNWVPSTHMLLESQGSQPIEPVELENVPALQGKQLTDEVLDAKNPFGQGIQLAMLV